MKILFILLTLSAFLYLFVPNYKTELHELIYLYADKSKRLVYMNDTRMNEIVAIKYSPELFEMDFEEVCQISGNPVFTFLYSDGSYYHK